MRTLYEQVLTQNFLYFWMFSRGRIKTMDGGEAIVVPLLYALNDTVKFYDSYDELDVRPQDGMTPARYEWKQLAGSLSMSRKEERQNSGRARILALLEAKMDQLRMSLNEKLGRISYGDGSEDDNKAFLGLKALVEAGSFGTLAGIDASTYTWWQNQHWTLTSIFSTTDWDNTSLQHAGDVIVGQSAMRKMYLACTRGTQQPDLGLTHVDTYSQYEAALTANQRFTDTDTASHGFMNLRFKKAVVSWDEDYINDGGGVGLFYFLNSDFLKVIVDTATNFVSTPMIRPHNQDQRTSQILLMGNMVALNRQRQGVISGIT
jgi:hypothetical protein